MAVPTSDVELRPKNWKGPAVAGPIQRMLQGSLPCSKGKDENLVQAITDELI